jgi:hypothetical protein
MAIEMRVQIPGMTAEHYAGMIGHLGPALRAAPGFVCHAAGPVDGGWGVTEVWESQAAWEAFVRAVVQPAAEAAGMPPLAPQVTPMSNVLTAALPARA